MEGKKNNWREIFAAWLGRTLPAATVANVASESLPAYLARLAVTAPGPVLAVFPSLTLAEESLAVTPLLVEVANARINCKLLPEIIDARRGLPENEPELSRVFHELLNWDGGMVVASVSALLAAAPSSLAMRRGTMKLEIGGGVGFEHLLGRLVELDYDDELEVGAPGEFARRGGIIDVFSPAHDSPARIEFFGDSIESIRSFSPETQRSLGEINEYTIIPRIGGDTEPDGGDFLKMFEDGGYRPILCFPDMIESHVERFHPPQRQARWRQFLADSAGDGKVARLLDAVESGAAAESAEICEADCFPATSHVVASLPDELGDGYNLLYQKNLSMELDRWLAAGRRVVMLAETDGGAGHLRQWIEARPGLIGQVAVEVFPLLSSLFLPGENLVALAEHDVFSHCAGQKRRLIGGAPTESAPGAEDRHEDLVEGRHAVHLVHGIGVFRGIQEVEHNGAIAEMIILEYADDVELQVPLWHGHLVSRYVGAGREAPKLNKLGGRGWNNAVAAANAAVERLAADMIRLQAARRASGKNPFPPDDAEQRTFEASFPFSETADQLVAIEEIKRDMLSVKPMDRLLCGDVGYGKTEVAMRAACKCVMAGRQVAVLVPTTVLARQHQITFGERFAEYPFVIESISRFQSPARQRDILARARSGGVDILIGTHRLVQPDIAFKDLGLVVIDEEQRFGVEHKERLKRLRVGVDVLNMTATPIPRTLYMSMAGIRDLSTLMTPPLSRLPVRTLVCQQDEDLIKEAIDNETRRGGQTYYLHNRVRTIEATTERLRKLLPDVRFAIAHGQMPDDEVELVMGEFVDGRIDALVCTTIIESGLDIPNANTIIIERADRFGLAELYQLRGRVGRWTRQAYAYLVMPPAGAISSDGRKRVAAMRKFTHLGAGFKLAMRDLEIRGAGNLLGKEQSGHISSIGFELYCQLLRNAVARLDEGGGDAPPPPEIDVDIDFVVFAHHCAARGRLPAAIPPSYIPSEAIRMDFYRRLGIAADKRRLAEIRAEMADRFGKPPEPVDNFLALAAIRILAAKAGFRKLACRDGVVLLERPSGALHKPDGKIPILKSRQARKMLVELAALVGKASE